jgi:uncharacterized protein with HEPN domain
MQPDDPALLLDIVLAARQVAEFVEHMTEEDFLGQVMFQNAVTYQVQTIGEAASRVSQQFQSAHPEIPWPKITGMRHRLVHGYRHVQLDLVWEAATTDIPSLIAMLEPLVPPEEP